MNKHVFRLVRVIRFLLKPFFPAKVYGDCNIEVKKSLLVGNHISGWDPIMMYVLVKPHIHFLYKAEINNVWPLKHLLPAVDLVPIKRGDIDVTATKKCLRILRNNKILTLFPEGTRNPNVNCLQELKTGAALYAIKERAPLRAFYIWDKAKLFRRNYVMIGEEFELTQFYGKAITKTLLKEATDIIAENIDNLRLMLNTILDAKGIKYRRRTPKEIRKIQQYNAKQGNIAKTLAVESDSATAPIDHE